MILTLDARVLDLAATSLSSRIGPLLDRTESGSIIATFARSCYIQLQRSIIAVVSAELLNGPLNLVIPLPADTALLHLPAGADVAVRGGVLEIAGLLRVDSGAAERWNPRLGPVVRSGARGAIRARGLALIRRILDAEAPPESFAHPGRRPRRAGDAMGELSGALRTGHVALAGKAASDLAGLGPGLTPSGDDVLAGTLLAVAVCEPSYAPALRAAILASVRGRTTRISEAYLEAAADGHAGEAWHRLLVVGDYPDGGSDAADLVAAVRQVMAFGETSGADMLAGFVLGMTALNSSPRPA